MPAVLTTLRASIMASTLSHKVKFFRHFSTSLLPPRPPLPPSPTQSGGNSGGNFWCRITRAVSVPRAGSVAQTRKQVSHEVPCEVHSDIHTWPANASAIRSANARTSLVMMPSCRHSARIPARGRKILTRRSLVRSHWQRWTNVWRGLASLPLSPSPPERHRQRGAIPPRRSPSQGKTHRCTGRRCRSLTAHQPFPDQRFPTRNLSDRKPAMC